MCVIQAVIFLISFLATQALDSAANCSDNWFGENCMYKCRCFGEVACDMSGKCPRDKCLHTYFGPGCQFFDIVSLSSAASTESYIYDFDKTTCNPDGSATSVEVELTTRYMFMWFRIEVNNTQTIFNFTVEINNDMQCINQRTFPLHDFVDVTCDSNTSLQALRITGTIAPYVCSIYVSAGRNVALKQSAAQFSTRKIIDRFAASNAVDGTVFSDVLNPSCTQSEEGIDSWWTLTFNRQQIIFAIYIINGQDRRDRLQGFTLRAFDKNGDTVIHYVDTSRLVLGRYVIPGVLMPVKVLNITIKNHPTSNAERILTMCEVQTIGETVCPEGTYGLWCGEKCKCSGTDICNAVIGICAPGCNSGFYGYNCSSPCNYTCLDGLCTNREGNCLGCIDGFVGEFCEHASSQTWENTSHRNTQAPFLENTSYRNTQAPFLENTSYRNTQAPFLENRKEEESTFSVYETAAVIALISSGISLGLCGSLFMCSKPEIPETDIEAYSPLELIKNAPLSI